MGLYARQECIWSLLRCAGSSVSGSKIPCGHDFSEKEGNDSNPEKCIHPRPGRREGGQRREGEEREMLKTSWGLWRGSVICWQVPQTREA